MVLVRPPRRAALVLAMSLAACFGGDGSDDDGGIPGPAPVVELGTGSVGFEPMIAEGDLGLVAGPQGGYHFIVHARMKNLAPGDPARPGRPENPSTVFAAFVPDGAGGEIQLDMMNPPYRLGYEDLDGDGWLELPSGRILQMNLLPPDVDAFYGSRVRITVTVTDATGRVDTDERYVIARDFALLGADAGPTPPDAGPVDAGVPSPDAP